MKRFSSSMILAGVLGASLAASANAAVVSFDNTAGVFLWEYYGVPCGGVLPTNPYILDITNGPNDQAPGSGVSGFYLQVCEPRPNTIWGATSLIATSGNQVVKGNIPAGAPSCMPATDWLSSLVAQSVGPASSFGTYGRVGVSPIGVPASCTDYRVFSPQGIAGVSIQIAGQTHYGWIQMKPVGTGPLYFKPTRWAYETTPNTPIQTPPTCPTSDMDQNGAVDTADLTFLLSEFGQTGVISPADLNNDHKVNTLDLVILLGNYGIICVR